MLGFIRLCPQFISIGISIIILSYLNLLASQKVCTIRDLFLMGNQHYYSIPRHCTLLNLHNFVADGTSDDFGSQLNKILLSPLGKGIKVIDLTKNLLDSKELGYLLPLISKNFPNVEELYLSHNEFCDLSLPAILKYVSLAKGLRILNLDDNLFTRAAINVLRKGINADQSAKLDHISLERNTIGYFPEDDLINCSHLNDRNCVRIKISQYHHSGNQLDDLNDKCNSPTTELSNDIVITSQSELNMKSILGCGSTNSYGNILELLDTIHLDHLRELSEDDINDIIGHLGVRDGRLALRCVCQIFATSALTDVQLLGEGSKATDDDSIEEISLGRSVSKVAASFIATFCASEFDQFLSIDVMIEAPANGYQ